MTALQLFLVIYLIVHMALCIAAYLLIRAGILRIPGSIMLIAALVPFAGVALAIVAEYNLLRKERHT